MGSLIRSRERYYATASDFLGIWSWKMFSLSARKCLCLLLRVSFFGVVKGIPKGNQPELGGMQSNEWYVCKCICHPMSREIV